MHHLRMTARLKFRNATAKDVAAIAGLRNAASGALTERFGAGHWSSLATERSVERSLKFARVRVGVADSRVAKLFADLHDEVVSAETAG